MGYETIILEKKENIATLTFNRPEKLNALNDKMGEELIDAFSVVDKDDDVKVVIVTGAGRAFSAGADIREWSLRKIEEKKKRISGDMTNDFNEQAPLALAKVRKPVIASINGVAVGFGSTMSLLCDIRIASENARFGFPFCRVGISPEMASSFLLPRLVGMGKACELIFTARIIDAQEAREIGLVNRVVSADDLARATYEMAVSIAKLAPLAIRVSKRALYREVNNDLTTQAQYEAFAINYLRGTGDAEEGVRAFLEKREPAFKGK